MIIVEMIMDKKSNSDIMVIQLKTYATSHRAEASMMLNSQVQVLETVPWFEL